MGLASADPPLDMDCSASLPNLRICSRKKSAPLIYKLLEEVSVLEEKKLHLGSVKKPSWKGTLESERKNIKFAGWGHDSYSDQEMQALYSFIYKGLQNLSIP